MIEKEKKTTTIFEIQYLDMSSEFMNMIEIEIKSIVRCGTQTIRIYLSAYLRKYVNTAKISINVNKIDRKRNVNEP